MGFSTLIYFTLNWVLIPSYSKSLVLNKSVADYISIFRIFSLITSRFCRAFIGKWLILNRYGVLILIIWQWSTAWKDDYTIKVRNLWHSLAMFGQYLLVKTWRILAGKEDWGINDSANHVGIEDERIKQGRINPGSPPKSERSLSPDIPRFLNKTAGLTMLWSLVICIQYI